MYSKVLRSDVHEMLSTFRCVCLWCVCVYSCVCVFVCVCMRACVCVCVCVHT